MRGHFLCPTTAEHAMRHPDPDTNSDTELPAPCEWSRRNATPFGGRGPNHRVVIPGGHTAKQRAHSALRSTFGRPRV
eukprot:CAMPEP_0174345572 /NCGR_PEP_ID=MMETSP0811_2-20130205/1075_1 /TAXON_ID=73025 ORGANISM="Eutreptiella gymnastica-like, Strain CCMP1594" /NCGR_SAMPLE_ID=MMETSP0811_2 /ASSEMBLY_ACC=CAM_ASM_000667 /LENGTH=76 /DNA_ID=CAMNT_0015469403 /DNA_START=532 /DNA_END=762 /DNA_ORIENTATION=+